MGIETKTNTELSTLNVIRVETALSRYPVHRLAKHRGISIDIHEQSENGEISIRWEVDHSGRRSPGPLAYKLDTLIVNRRIEEASRPIPSMIKLGSLNEICRELGSAESGKNTTHIKNAFHQNASAYIKARIRYRQADGTERNLEAGFTRYSVIFTGEKLPDGRTADAVYLLLSNVYMQVINGAMTRPLDYDYLRSLPPASQRFYEILSYHMYAALKYDRARAKMVYSEYCRYAPQTRYFEFDGVKKQMYKIHTHHRKSGYIDKVEFQQATDSDGKPDWIMFYIPGHKARAEYKTFTRRGGPAVLEVEPLTAGPLSTLAGPELTQLEMELIRRGVTPAIANELVREHGDEKIREQIEYLDWLIERRPKKKIADPAAYLVSALRNGGHAAPAGFESKAVRQAREEARQAREREATEERRHRQKAEVRERAAREVIAAYWDSLSAQEQAALDEQAKAQADPAMLTLEEGPLKELGRRIRRKAHIRCLLQQQGKLPPTEG